MGTKKYTLELDEGLVEMATKATGQTFSETVRQGLRILAADEAYRELAKMRGKLDLQLDIKAGRRSKRDSLPEFQPVKKSKRDLR